MTLRKMKKLKMKRKLKRTKRLKMTRKTLKKTFLNQQTHSLLL